MARTFHTRTSLCLIRWADLSLDKAIQSVTVIEGMVVLRPLTTAKAPQTSEMVVQVAKLTIKVAMTISLVKMSSMPNGKVYAI